MATGFGFSVGDFIAGISLVQTVIKALSDSRGSSKEYLELIYELRTLEYALLEAKALDLQTEQRAHRSALREAVRQCQAAIDDFLQDLTKYCTHLRLGGSLCAWKDAYRKIQWRLCKKDDLVRFRNQIGLHVQSIQMLMLTIQINSASLHTESLQNQSAQMNDQRNALRDVQAAINNALGSLARVDRTGRANLMASLQCFKLLQNMHNPLPPQIERQQPVIFRDALNRVAPFHLEFINSHEAFFAVLETRFKNVGIDKVRRREFALQNAGETTDIDLRKSWEACFCPGQRVDMSMIFKQQGPWNMTVCPVCKHECFGETSSEIECPVCMRCFRRVVDMTEDTRERGHKVKLSQSTPITRDQKRKHDEQDGPDQIHYFQRIRVLCKQSRSKLMTCNRIWDRLQSMEKFRNGEIDVDNLCAELRPKARCSEGGAVVDEADVDRILDKFGKDLSKSVYPDSLKGVLSRKQTEMEASRDDARLTTNTWEDDEKVEEYVIECYCGIDDDDGNTVFCEMCGTWQHIQCYYANEIVPEVHVCTACEPRSLVGNNTAHRRKRMRESLPNANDDRKRNGNSVLTTSFPDHNTSLLSGVPHTEGLQQNIDGNMKKMEQATGEMEAINRERMGRAGDAAKRRKPVSHTAPKLSTSNLHMENREDHNNGLFHLGGSTDLTTYPHLNTSRTEDHSGLGRPDYQDFAFPEIPLEFPSLEAPELDANGKKWGLWDPDFLNSISKDTWWYNQSPPMGDTRATTELKSHGHYTQFQAR